MPFPVAYLLIAGGVCACAPLFKRVPNPLGRLLSIIGFFVGIAIIIVAADTALGLDFFSSRFTSPSIAALESVSPYLVYYLPLMIVLGLLLFSRPLRNIRWASLISLAVGLLIAYYLGIIFSGMTSTILIVVFLIATLAIYTLLRFVEDIFGFVGTVLAFPPIAVGVGLVAVYFGIIIAISFP